MDQKKIKTDQVIKKLVRLFRHLIKERFIRIFDKRQYHWIDRTKKEKTRNFFVREYGVPVELYNQHEDVFFKLVHNTSFEDGDQVSQIFKKVFGNFPNKKNLREFFKLGAI